MCRVGRRHTAWLFCQPVILSISFSWRTYPQLCVRSFYSSRRCSLPRENITSWFFNNIRLFRFKTFIIDCFRSIFDPVTSPGDTHERISFSKTIADTGSVDRNGSIFKTSDQLRRRTGQSAQTGKWSYRGRFHIMCVLARFFDFFPPTWLFVHRF